MSYVYLLAGEDLELAKADLQGFLRSQKIEETSDVVSRLASTETEPEQLKRLGLTHEVSKILYRGKKESIDFDYRPQHSYAVRAENIDAEIEGAESEIGEYLSTEENSVDLENPVETIKIYVLEDEIVVGKVIEDIDRSLFQERTNDNREFSSPVSLDPVLARVLVNLSEAPPGSHVIDPFCGTGGILIEAGLCGIGVHGSDIQKEMVKGTRKNLEEYGIIVHDIKECAIDEVSEEFGTKFDALVTDLPYGQSSKSENRPIQNFLQSMDEIADTKVFMYNEPELAGYEASFEVYVHKNLTRYIYVLD
ncbi:methyltransferase domain-containing protein [Candidatus Nanohalococcus occultus]|uniref:tRNA G10 N-methylase Trm11 n=1 Tax=Candidatus Nanohalococcus occultus TaxID=2978047 RepID=A0ABY8CDY1_9ARCH|nr:tRNA G10 N-methylase Trm11 [Candidatus Nanohaloarchaeota archaeon SVXNc]